jgi:hypothetical protein
MQISHFSCSFYSTTAGFRCFLASVMPFFHSGKYPPRVQTEKQAVAQQKTATKSGKGRTSTKTKSSPKASHKAKPSTTKSRSKAGTKSASEKSVTIDRRRSPRRDEDSTGGSRTTAVAAPKLERRKKVNRRRQIDPTTCERDYTDDEIQFMNALDDYKRASGRMFPTCSEVLEVLRRLGYVRHSSAETKPYEANMVTFKSEEETVTEFENDYQASP